MQITSHKEDSFTECQESGSSKRSLKVPFEKEEARASARKDFGKPQLSQREISFPEPHFPDILALSQLKDKLP